MPKKNIWRFCGMTKQYVRKSVPVLACSALLFSAAPVSAEEHSVEDVIENSREAMYNLESLSVDTEIEYSYERGEEQIVDYHVSEEDIISSPFMMRGFYTTTADDGSEFNWAMYSTESAFYNQDSDGPWVVIREGDEGFERPDFKTTMDEMYFYDIDLFADEFSLSEEDGMYVLTYDSSGGTYEDVLEPSLSGDMDEGLTGDVDEYDEITDVFYEVHIDKETYYLTDMYREFHTSYTDEGERIDVRDSLWRTFHNFNGVEPFEVPSEVVDGAVDYADYYPDYYEEGDELPATANNYPFYVLAGLLTAAAAGGLLAVSRRKTGIEV
ncbi:hypothetical protein C6Y45_10710 [Alkalicoccus saliphilus]|uniref:Gram-positive cocci surface proteins LPxTG domain-containing protein n=2 Tax=Alkalicoccus saliphilus TaxID=200989 RepID=A0A2T4U529_9BACI|nr:hypothetical protein C6Y45_10710 [Alkalicoccus saliphilus]